MTAKEKLKEICKLSNEVVRGFCKDPFVNDLEISQTFEKNIVSESKTHVQIVDSVYPIMTEYVHVFTPIGLSSMVKK